MIGVVEGAVKAKSDKFNELSTVGERLSFIEVLLSLVLLPVDPNPL
jgi:hypothetical protein